MTPNRSPWGDDEGSRPLEVGDSAPGFELPGADDAGVGTFGLSEYTRSGGVVLAFYPFDFSPVCTRQLCGLRDTGWLTFTEDVDVLGLSVDSAYAHRRFREAYDITFPLLSDRLGDVAAAYGVRYDSWENHPAVCKRALFAVDDTGTVRYRWYTEDANRDPPIEELEATVEWLG